MAIVTEKTVYYKRLPENCNQICLRWINSKGGVSVWVFTHEIQLEPVVNRGQFFRKNVEDYSDGADIFAALPHSIGKKAILKADSLETQEADALEFIAASPKVWEIFKNDDGTFKKIEVEAVSVESSYNPESPLTDLTVTIQRPNKPFL